MKRICVINILILVLAILSCSVSSEKPKKPEDAPCSFKNTWVIEKHPPLLQSDNVRIEKNEIVFLGDSLTYGAELKRTEPFPQLINAFWKTEGVPFVAVNGGMNGKTTEQTLWRLNDVIGKKTYAVFLEIGANDWNQKRPIKDIKKDYEELIISITQKKIKLYLAEIRVASDRPGFDQKYTAEFNAMYELFSKKYKLPLMRDFTGSVRSENLFLADNIHPNKCGHRLLARDVLSFLNSDWKFVP